MLEDPARRPNRHYNHDSPVRDKRDSDAVAAVVLAVLSGELNPNAAEPNPRRSTSPGKKKEGFSFVKELRKGHEKSPALSNVLSSASLGENLVSPMDNMCKRPDRKYSEMKRSETSQDYERSPPNFNPDETRSMMPTEANQSTAVL